MTIFRLPNAQWLSPEQFTLAPGETVSIRKCFLHFKRWEPPTGDTYGRKVELNYAGERVFAELAIVRLLERDGFDAVWVNPRFGRTKFWRALWTEHPLPSHVRELYDEIIQKNDNRRGGCWDVLAWKQDAYLFIESKQKSRDYKDRIRPSQRRWLDAAMRAGIAPSCFVVCEWDAQHCGQS